MENWIGASIIISYSFILKSLYPVRTLCIVLLENLEVTKSDQHSGLYSVKYILKCKKKKQKSYFLMLYTSILALRYGHNK